MSEGWYYVQSLEVCYCGKPKRTGKFACADCWQAADQELRDRIVSHTVAMDVLRIESFCKGRRNTPNDELSESRGRKKD